MRLTGEGRVEGARLMLPVRLNVLSLGQMTQKDCQRGPVRTALRYRTSLTDPISGCWALFR